eukprot:12800118-Alexandrium_andersonii.AAC.1
MSQPARDCNKCAGAETGSALDGTMPACARVGAGTTTRQRRSHAQGKGSSVAPVAGPTHGRI